ncbi:MAG: class I SAM-dependent methyltransferase [Bacteroidetes bacterium]|nr:class I SAM-dependent methyltransferase [Bacteroidota bacterium]
MSSERQLLNKRDPWWGEHIHRYNEVLKYVRANDVILDIACGTGFGSQILARHTKGAVTGGDIAEDAVKECKRNWQQPNLDFKVLDGTQLPYSDEYFDIVVSFETIEHTTLYWKMIKEFFRVLKQGGTALISTPNFPINSPTGKVTNPYHTQEFDYNELSQILNSVFSSVKIEGQQFNRYNKKNFSTFMARLNYAFFNIIGIRKFTPFKIKNYFSKLFSGYPFYPTPSDFVLVDEREEIIKCKTFFCICKKH